MDTTLDPDIVNLAKATRTVESNNNPTAKGQSGEYGYYQYTPDTWAAQSKAAGVNIPLQQATPAQQNEVWYKWAEAKKKAGNNVGQIASMQNAGEGKPNAYLEGNSGVNSYGVSYDTAAYAKKVAEEYQKLKSANGSGTVAIPQNDSQAKTFSDIASQIDPKDKSGFLGTNPNDSTYGKILNNSITRGVENFGNLLTLGGAGELGNEVGASVATIGEKTKGLLGGQDNSKYIADPNVNKALLGGAKSIVGAATTALAGNTAKGFLPKSVLESPAVETALKGFDLSLDEFKNLKSADKLEYLTQSLEGSSAANKAVIQQAIEEVTPQAIKEAGGKVAFSKAYPTIAKVIGLLKNGIGTSLKAYGADKLISGLLNK